MLWTVDMVFGSSPPHVKPPRCLLMGCLTSDGNGCTEASSNWRYIFLLFLVDRVQDAARLVFRTLWPERAWLIARYGHYTVGTRLRHLLKAARGKI